MDDLEYSRQLLGRLDHLQQAIDSVNHILGDCTIHHDTDTAAEILAHMTSTRLLAEESRMLARNYFVRSQQAQSTA